MFICPKCKQEKKDGEYYLRRDGRPNSYCKDCNLYHAKQRQQKFKYDCVQYKGGKCCKCGYDKCLGSLHFHHRDPNGKDLNISQLRFTNFIKNIKVKEELDKCDLLCANCHGEEHWTRMNFIEPKEKIVIEPSYCQCGSEKLPMSNKCLDCFNNNRETKIKWPTKEELEKLVWEKPVSIISKEFGVTDNAVGRWCKKYNITKPGRGYWMKQKHKK